MKPVGDERVCARKAAGVSPESSNGLSTTPRDPGGSMRALLRITAGGTKVPAWQGACYVNRVNCVVTRQAAVLERAHAQGPGPGTRKPRQLSPGAAAIPNQRQNERTQASVAGEICALSPGPACSGTAGLAINRGSIGVTGIAPMANHSGISIRRQPGNEIRSSLPRHDRELP